MDALITAAARALAAGDPLAALDRVALREDAPALALRGIAMAQLGEFARARALLEKSARAFDPHERVARARCAVAQAEIAFASRDLGWPTKALEAACTTLERQGDRINAAHGRYLTLRRLLLIGRLDEAERRLAEFDPESLPAALQAIHALIVAGIALRRQDGQAARTALRRATSAAHRAAIPALRGEVESAWQLLDAPAARLMRGGHAQLVRLEQVQALLGSGALVLDLRRQLVQHAGVVVSLAGRPVLLALLAMVGQHWPEAVTRETLIAEVFRLPHPDESQRARLRVEIGRLRRLLRPLASLIATPRGFALVPQAADVAVLGWPVDGPHTAVLAVLMDGESWSSSALALALGVSQRSVQRALDSLAAAGKVQAFGRGRVRRWATPPVPGFATTLLLPLPWSY
ncbi:DNA-binding response regulator, OmpR family, contains REC and winged-helix (wHTH) domain [Pseudomonas sp. ok272]|uniref:helix-turn-helix domain-containing protein n=1 Tax=unclassified Pseudomonas TaxID=196821 RepID=UPI0008AE6EC2|nr:MULTISPECIES: helix-turn-helix domain-containing protein [unclassified Pseudomonas]SEN23650.1 DNA-binding response regulator, OmpR family, contains REC and winged-helix (wHTH) domain [Pseudomonas sp. ok272]SFN14866.1 DNA-binding response regulator, OmpR family, contains REC and winged-helix (wHTH) domain [Pseudomonas sp. ok602]